MGKEDDDDQSSGGSSENCSQCFGSGVVNVTEEHGETVTEHKVRCGLCNGTGKRG